MDDDTYVNVPQLLQLLQEYNHQEDWYLGKPSLQYPIEIMDRDKPGVSSSFTLLRDKTELGIDRHPIEGQTSRRYFQNSHHGEQTRGGYFQTTHQGTNQGWVHSEISSRNKARVDTFRHPIKEQTP